MIQKLRVFLCHASEDKPAVRELYKLLATKAWIEPWLDEKNLLPGQDWNLEINKATREADVIIICMSKVSVAKEGYLNKEIRRVLDISGEKLEGAIYIIPLRLDDCEPSFERLKQIHYADYFLPNAHERLLKSLSLRANSLKIETSKSKINTFIDAMADTSYNVDLDLYRFIQIPATEEVPYSFYIGKYPVTNAQYERFLNSPDFADNSFWTNIPKFNEDCVLVGRWTTNGLDWLDDTRKKIKMPLKPRHWEDENFGVSNPNHPVVDINWYEANAYCNWLLKHWNTLAESKANSNLYIRQIRLPLDLEWTLAAGGETPKNRYPWDLKMSITVDEKELKQRANVSEGKIGHTTPVNAYIRGVSPFGVMDMAGNVWEWQAYVHSYDEKRDEVFLALRGGSWVDGSGNADVSNRGSRFYPSEWNFNIGFRVIGIPSS